VEDDGATANSASKGEEAVSDTEEATVQGKKSKSAPHARAPKGKRVAEKSEKAQPKRKR
jgi:hypothetical protein